MSWQAQTYKDVHGLPFNPTLRAPCCKRKESADMLVDARMQPPELRPRGEDYHCCACRERIFMTGAATRVEYWGRHNPPQEFMDALVLKLGGN